MSDHYNLLKARFQVAPPRKHATEIYNYLTGNDGTSLNEYGDVVVTAVWNMEPFDFLYDSKHIDYFFQSRNGATKCVAEYMDKYYRKAKRMKFELYPSSTQINNKGLPW